MKTRMERYFDEQDEVARTKKNQDLYEDIYNNLPSSNVTVLDTGSEIDISKIKELVESREGYKRVRQYQSIMKTPDIEEEKEEYDIYKDIDNKIYDINMILEDAKSKRVISDREKYRNMRNTQYDILSKLNLSEEPEVEEMVSDFFTQDKAMKSFITNIHKEVKESNDKTGVQSKVSVDLFEDLKGGENTILTEALTEEKINSAPNNATEDAGFYTSHFNFTKEDFEGFQNLQTTVKKNNKLIKVLITILMIVLIAIVVFLAFTML